MSIHQCLNNNQELTESIYIIKPNHFIRLSYKWNGRCYTMLGLDLVIKMHLEFAEIFVTSMALFNVWQWQPRSFNGYSTRVLTINVSIINVEFFTYRTELALRKNINRLIKSFVRSICSLLRTFSITTEENFYIWHSSHTKSIEMEKKTIRNIEYGWVSFKIFWQIGMRTYAWK